MEITTVKQLNDFAHKICDIYIESVEKLRSLRKTVKEEKEINSQAIDLVKIASGETKKYLDIFQKTFVDLRGKIDKRIQEEKTKLPVDPKDLSLQQYCSNLIQSQRISIEQQSGILRNSLVEELVKEYLQAIKNEDWWYVYFVEFYVYKKLIVYGSRQLSEVVENFQRERIIKGTKENDSRLQDLNVFYQRSLNFDGNLDSVKDLFDALQRDDIDQVELLFRIRDFARENPVYQL